MDRPAPQSVAAAVWRDDRSAARARLLLVGATAVYALARFPIGPAGLVALACLLFAGIEAAQWRFPNRIVRLAAAPLQFALVCMVAYGPSPFGLRDSLPGPMIVGGPLFLGLMCVLVSYAGTLEVWTVITSAAALILLWTWGVFAVKADPLTITKANLVLSRIKTMAEMARAVNQPHYLHLDFWRNCIYAAGVVGLTLSFMVIRIRALGRKAVASEAEKRVLESHFSPEIAALMAASQPGMPVQERQVAVLDCDLVGFSREVELLPPETIAERLRAFRSSVAEAVFIRNGAVLNMVVDGVVAVFGLTGDPAAAARNAVETALTLRQAWDRLGQSPLALGVDVGMAGVGVVGEGRSMALLMQGPSIDGAARLQAETRVVGTSLLVSDRVIQAVPSAADRFEPLSPADPRSWRMRESQV
jgi:class 3 adenylate cyclase